MNLIVLENNSFKVARTCFMKRMYNGNTKKRAI